MTNCSPGRGGQKGASQGLATVRFHWHESQAGLFSGHMRRLGWFSTEAKGGGLYHAQQGCPGNPDPRLHPPVLSLTYSGQVYLVSQSHTVLRELPTPVPQACQNAAWCYREGRGVGNMPCSCCSTLFQQPYISFPIMFLQHGSSGFKGHVLSPRGTLSHSGHVSVGASPPPASLCKSRFQASHGRESYSLLSAKPVSSRGTAAAAAKE